MLLLVATRSYSFIQQTSSFVSFSPTLVSSSSMHCVPSMWGGYSLAACGFRPFFPRLRGIGRFFLRLRGVSRFFCGFAAWTSIAARGLKAFSLRLHGIWRFFLRHYGLKNVCGAPYFSFLSLSPTETFHSFPHQILLP